MEYIFGTIGKSETLRTKWDYHTDLTGFQQIVRKDANGKTTDYFYIIRKIKSKEDDAGNCYDWYEIDRHYRDVDHTEPILKVVDELSSLMIDQEYALTMLELGVEGGE